ncbi:MAG: hypothetical protein R3D29_07800 [Nitratireductor sp.]
MVAWNLARTMSNAGRSVYLSILPAVQLHQCAIPGDKAHAGLKELIGSISSASTLRDRHSDAHILPVGVVDAGVLA